MTLRPRPSLSEEQMRAALREHVLYEHGMLNQIAEELIEAEAGRRERPPDLYWNTAIESFLIHARNLAYFFSAGRVKASAVRPDDVVAEDYFDEPSDWARAALPVTQRLDELLKFGGRVAKEIAHLTYARLEKKSAWDIAGINQDLFDQMECFLQHTPFPIATPED